jgi:hypothetical protein
MMDEEEFHISDYDSDLLDDELFMDDLDVGSIPEGPRSTSEQASGLSLLDVESLTPWLIAGAVVLITIIISKARCWDIENGKGACSSEDEEVRKLKASHAFQRLSTSSLNEVERYVHDTCKHIENGGGVEIHILFAAHARLKHELEALDKAEDVHPHREEERIEGLGGEGRDSQGQAQGNRNGTETDENEASRRYKKVTSDAHSLLKAIEAVMAVMLGVLPQAPTPFNLHHRGRQVRLMDALSRLNALMEPLRQKVDKALVSTLSHKVADYASTLHRHLKRARAAETALCASMGQHEVHSDADVVVELDMCHRGDDTDNDHTQARTQAEAKVQFELAARKLTEGVAFLSVYDNRSGKYAALLHESITQTERMHSTQGRLEGRALQQRLLKEDTAMQKSMHHTQQALLALSPATSPERGDKYNTSGIGGVLTTHPTPPRDTQQMITAGEAGVVINPNPNPNPNPDSGNLSLIYSNYLLASQSRRSSIEEDSQRRADKREQRRVDVEVAARQAAELQFHNDTEAEIDKKLKLAGLNLQRSALKVADEGWADTKKMQLEQAYTARMRSRRNGDVAMAAIGLLVITMAFCATAFKCDVVGGMRAATRSKLSQLCFLLSREGCAAAAASTTNSAAAAAGAAAAAAASGAMDSYYSGDVGGGGAVHRVSSQFYGALFTGLRGVSTNLLALTGLDLSLGAWVLSEALACGVQLALRMVTPLLVSKIARTLLGLSGVHATFLLLCLAYLSLSGPVQALLAPPKPYLALAAGHTVVCTVSYALDGSLHWGGGRWRLGGGRDPSNYRALCLYVLYPLLAMAAALLLGCALSSSSYSRGVLLGRRVGFSELLECVPSSLAVCVAALAR